MSLRDIITARIRSDGPISIAEQVDHQKLTPARGGAAIDQHTLFGVQVAVEGVTAIELLAQLTEQGADISAAVGHWVQARLPLVVSEHLADR